jgi:hypothetical protein
MMGMTRYEAINMFNPISFPLKKIVDGYNEKN